MCGPTLAAEFQRGRSDDGVHESGLHVPVSLKSSPS